MPRTEWLRLTEACQVGRLTQNVLYRLAALGEVRTRRTAGGPIEFHRGDLERVREQRAARAPAPAATAAGGAR